MRTDHKVVAVFALVGMVVSPVFAQDMPVPAPVSCASSAAAVEITATVPASATSAKVYFSAAGPEYYVDMRRGANGTMWAFIPAPETTTKSFNYRVISTDGTGKQVSSPLLTLTTAASCPARGYTAPEQVAANNIVVGLTNASQSPVPSGFLCRGVVSYIAANGQLRPNDECRRLAALGGPGSSGATSVASTTTGSTTTVSTTAANGAGLTTGTTSTGAAAAETSSAAAGLSAGTIVALTAAGLAVAGVVVYRNTHRHHHNPSPSAPGQ